MSYMLIFLGVYFLEINLKFINELQTPFHLFQLYISTFHCSHDIGSYHLDLVYLELDDLKVPVSSFLCFLHVEVRDALHHAWLTCSICIIWFWIYIHVIFFIFFSSNGFWFFFPKSFPHFYLFFENILQYILIIFTPPASPGSSPIPYYLPSSSGLWRSHSCKFNKSQWTSTGIVRVNFWVQHPPWACSATRESLIQSLYTFSNMCCKNWGLFKGAVPCFGLIKSTDFLVNNLGRWTLLLWNDIFQIFGAFADMHALMAWEISWFLLKWMNVEFHDLVSFSVKYLRSYFHWSHLGLSHEELSAFKFAPNYYCIVF